MRVIGESKTVDLSKKLTVEITLGELAILTAVIGKKSGSSIIDSVENSRVIKAQYKDDIKEFCKYRVFRDMADVLKSEGVTE